MKGSLEQIEKEYSRALREYLAGAGQAALQRAYESGRKAVAEGLGLSELATAHHNVLETAMRSIMTPERRADTIKAAGGFFAEALTPFETTHRALKEASCAEHRLNERMEGEATRVAHALHDQIGQLVTSLHLKLADVTRDLPLHIREQFQQFEPLLDSMGEELRQVSHELRPLILDDLGIVSALEFLAQGVARRTGLAIKVESFLNERPRRAVETTLYRVVQESLTNVVKHARTSSVTIRIDHFKGMIVCSIRDDGIGFEVAAGWAKRGLGLIGIRDRIRSVGGILKIISALGQGTEVVITIPTENEDGDSYSSR